MGQLTTHVLDTSAGVPAAGIRIELHQLTATGAAALRSHLVAQRRIADLGLRRLAGAWGAA